MPRLYKPGSFLRIPLADGSFGYGRVLKLPHDAYYNYRTETLDSNLDRIASKPILFKLSVRHMGEREWELIGWRKLEKQFSQPIVQFMQDRGNFRDCLIFDTAGNERSAEPQECVGLERASVWEELGVEERLLDTFMGRPNDTVERHKVRLK
ncbi:immunity 26/phosphotriesterase HocA family protein [Stigmatella sp. ncwal1]|uniref:Immunity 26/phosphotriesterase HocA family protein n=1 Tax=Stigmatella ashevillensis TaxID=2995309 RepID=A0ABT5DN87_9BACT|nr:immunity 26/phosphotriesterase HocA family protein [Stigmatella ashevillena]MDC0715109.1 immunity 26/phosphotriesterase HocA family protein [Stigmatella ashevillena]